IFDADSTAGLKSLARSNGATLYMTLLSGFTLMLHRLGQQNDLIVGSPVTGRPFKGSHHVVGYCTHLMPVRSRIVRPLSISNYIRQMRKTLLDCLDHQDLPFAEIVAKRRQQQDAVSSPLVSTVFNLEPVSSFPEVAGLRVNLYKPTISFTPFDLR